MADPDPPPTLGRVEGSDATLAAVAQVTIGPAATGEDGRPLESVHIERVTVG